MIEHLRCIIAKADDCSLCGGIDFRTLCEVQGRFKIHESNICVLSIVLAWLFWNQTNQLQFRLPWCSQIQAISMNWEPHTQIFTHSRVLPGSCLSTCLPFLVATSCWNVDLQICTPRIRWGSHMESKNFSLLWDFQLA